MFEGKCKIPCFLDSEHSECGCIGFTVVSDIYFFVCIQLLYQNTLCLVGTLRRTYLIFFVVVIVKKRKYVRNNVFLLFLIMVFYCNVVKNHCTGQGLPTSRRSCSGRRQIKTAWKAKVLAEGHKWHRRHRAAAWPLPGSMDGGSP